MTVHIVRHVWLVLTVLGTAVYTVTHTGLWDLTGNCKDQVLILMFCGVLILTSRKGDSHQGSDNVSSKFSHLHVTR